jgi:heterodisulfide reductase subunit B
MDLSDFGFAVHHGCHYSRPADIYGGFDDAENPHTLAELVQAIGARLVRYGQENECCGGGILAMDMDTALAIAKSKLDRIDAAQADGLVLVCPFCDIMYEINQRSIERQYGVTYRLPVFYYPQLLGLALGFPPNELGFRLNRVKSKKLLQRFQE